MRFVYAVINLLILAGLIYLVGRKTIVKIFRSRREKITRELDEAETPFAPEPLPEMPAPDDTALKSELAAVEKDGKAALAELDTQYEADAADQRREMLFTTRAQIIEQVLTLAEQHMRSAEYQASKLARQNEAVEQILAQIHLTPGDVSYISRKGVLYVTLTSAAVLPDETVEKVRTRAEALVAAGYKDITLLGQNVNSYGLDKHASGDTSFARLLRKVSELPGLARLRFVTPHPKDLSPEVIAMFGEVPNLCPRLHLPLQAGSDRVLARMNRKYDTARFYESVTLLRRYFDRPAITTDLICGFPGETEAEFDATLSFIEKCGFAAMHIFPYSIRPGTKAAAMEQVPSAVKEQRAGRAAQAAETMHQTYLQGCVGRVYPVLFEQEKDGYYTGHAPNYCEVGVRANDLHNKVLDVKITGIIGEMLVGELT